MPTRKVVLVLGLVVGLWMSATAQDHMPNRMNTYTDEPPETGFRKENLFVGGGLGLGFGSYNFNIGLNPEIGYSLNRWLDVGAVVNFTYNSEGADPTGFYNPDVSTKQFVYGGGVFGRAYVLPFLFLTAQPELNWTSTKQTYEPSGPVYNLSATAPSLLLGLGYGRRVVGESGFYIALLFDVAGNVNSPYNDYFGHPLPVVRAGFDIYLHHSR